MKAQILTVLVVLAAVVAAHDAQSHDSSLSTLLTPIILRANTVARPVLGADNNTHVMYELIGINAAESPVNIQQVDVVDESSGKVVFVLEGEDLSKHTVVLADRRSTSNIEAGESFYLFIRFPWPQGEVPDAPVNVTQTIHIELNNNTVNYTSGSNEILFGYEPPVLGAPLKGEGFAAISGCCDNFVHAVALLPLNGELFLSQRFAIDWIRLNESNAAFKGNGTQPSDWYIYDLPLYAVGDGEITQTLSTLQDGNPFEFPPNVTAESVLGNHIVMKLDGYENTYVMYAHMKTGSLLVSEGDRVIKGQEIGRTGNTGNSNAPHLHLHVCNGPNALASDGLPYVFESFNVTGELPPNATDGIIDDRDPLVAVNEIDPPEEVKDSLPMDSSVIGFA